MGTEEKRHIYVCDTGASRTKFIYGRSGGKPEFHSMSPYCKEVEWERASALTAWGAVGIESAVVLAGGKTYVVGKEVESDFGSDITNKERKYEKAIYKCLATIGYLAEVHGVENGSTISVGILLPFNEYNTRQQFVASFKEFIKDFDYCGVHKSYELNGLTVRPEGSGVERFGIPKSINRATSRIASAVIGHRNASWLVTMNGLPQINECSTVDLGFRWLVQKVEQRTGFHDELSTAEQVFNSYGGESLPDIEDAVFFLKDSYWAQLKEWFESRPPVDCVVMSGGASLALRDELTSLFGNRCVWPDKLTAQVQRSIKDPIMSVRFADALGLYKIVEDRIEAERNQGALSA